MNQTPEGSTAPGERRSSSRTRQRIRARRKRNKRIRFAGIGLLVVGVAAAIWWNRPPPIEINEATLCPIPTPTGVHAVLLNRSDPINARQQQRVNEVLQSVVADARIGGRVAFYVSDRDDVTRLSPVLALCNPGVAANELYRSPRAFRTRYDQEFRDQIAALNEALRQPTPRNTQPVIESIRAVCIDAFRDAPLGTPLRMTIVGDMIQYSGLANHYRDREYEALLGNRIEPFRADCKGAEVDIVYLQRPAPRLQASPQGPTHQRFWDGLLRRMNARPRNLEVV